MPNEENIEDEVNSAFSRGTVFEATDNDLKRYLRYLSSGHVPNEMVRHREMIRGVTINTIKTFRFMDEVNKTNKKYTIIIIVLSVIAVLVSDFSIWQSITSSHQMENLIEIQQKQLLELQEKETLNKPIKQTR